VQTRAYEINQSIIRQINCRSYREQTLNETGQNTPTTALSNEKLTNSTLPIHIFLQNKTNAEINDYCSTCFYFYFTCMGDFNKLKTLKSQKKHKFNTKHQTEQM